MIQRIQWQTTSTLWTEALKDDDNKRFRQPVILRFASDAFIEELGERLADDPSSLVKLVARQETWKTAPSLAAGWQSYADLKPDQPLKLYQPVHQRFYLVAASLVCRLPGLPDKPVDVASEEKVSYVLRRLVPRNTAKPVRPSDPSTYFEYGRSEISGWQKLEPPYNRLAEGEERLPLFAMTYGENGQQRRLLAGFLPVAGRETYQASPQITEPQISAPTVPQGDLTSEDSLADPRMARFEAMVVEGLQQLRDAIAKQQEIDKSGSSSDGKPVTITTAQAREVLVFALLDLATFLNEELNSVWQAIRKQTPAGLDTDERRLYDRLRTHLVPGASQWDGLLRDVWSKRNTILTQGTEGLTLLTDGLSMGQIKDGIDRLGLASLTDLVKAALPAREKAEEAKEPETPAVDPVTDAIYVLRCAYERPRCKGVFAPVVSESSQAFQLASFFDPDAPARPMRVTLPVDTSIAGLKKFPKNVSFLVSDQLRKQIERVQGVKMADLDDGELGEEPDIDLGMICSLSIPIITICALILLMIIVQLLNIVFWWLPFFKICFPLNLKAK